MDAISKKRIEELKKAHEAGKTEEFIRSLRIDELSQMIDELASLVPKTENIEVTTPNDLVSPVVIEPMEEQKKDYDQELEERLIIIKKVFDNAYRHTQYKYGKLHADTAVRDFFLRSDVMWFTGKENREMLKELLNHPNEIYQLLFDYAISKYILDETNGIKHDVTLDEVKKYTNVKDSSLNYNENHITSVVAIGTAWSPHWTTNLIACNPQVMQALVNDFVKGRYNGQKKQLDCSKKTKRIKQPNGRTIIMSKYALNRTIASMNDDDMIEPFNPETITQGAEQKTH